MKLSMSDVRAGWRKPVAFHVVLALLLALLMWSRPPSLDGDVEEYLLLTVALASHGTPQITAPDIVRARQLAPALGGGLDALSRGMDTGSVVPRPGFYRSRDGAVRAIHFFGYSALAAVPWRLLESAGLSPLRCFQVVNLAAVFLLGACLLRLFGDARKAAFGVALFMLSGGALYWNWTGPECLTAAALLSSMILFVADAPIAAGVLAGIASLQNPSVGAFCAFAPLLRVAAQWRRERRWSDNVRRSLGSRHWCGVAVALVLFALPNAFSLWAFGVPNVIVSVGGASLALVSVARLQSYFLDLNQGMLIGIPAVFVALLLWSWRGVPRARAAAMLALCAAMTLVLAMPALAVYNWNSGSRGVARYAFWGAMPLVFGFLWLLRERARWPMPLLATVLGVQAAGAVYQTAYSYVEFSPLASAVMARAPALYNPEPEVFAERLEHREWLGDPQTVYVYRSSGLVTKVLYHEGVADLDARVCGSHGALADTPGGGASGASWRYLDGPVDCVPAEGRRTAAADYGLPAFETHDDVQFPAGWSMPEHGGGIWDGIWSDGARSRIVIAGLAKPKPTGVLLLGHYFAPHQRTRVTINGRDYGWRRLDDNAFLPLDPVPGSALTIDLEHDDVSLARGVSGDTRQLAVFIHRISLR